MIGVLSHVPPAPAYYNPARPAVISALPSFAPRPVMPVMVPQNPPIGTPVYYQQPVMGPAWSPYVPLVEAYNEMPCYPADYGNPGYYPPSYANPVYQNNPMEYMPPNPAGDPAGPPAVPPQSDVQQTAEGPSRSAGCSQCGGCGSCCTCNRPRTSPPLLNHEPRTAAGPINFGAEKSVKDDGSDLPNDIATLRFFYNLGVEAHQSASRGVPNGDAEADQAEDDEKKEITNLVGRLHKVLFRQNPEPQELQNTNCSEHPTNGSEMWNTKNDSTHLPTKVVGVDLSRVETEILTRTESDVEEEEEEPQTDNGVELIYEMRCDQVLHTAMKPPAIRDLDESDNGREPLHMELFPPLPNPRVGPGRRGGRGLHDTARFPLNQRNADHPRLPPIYYVNPGKFPWSQNQKDGNMGRGIDSMRGTGRLRARRDSEDYSGGMSARPGDTNEQNSSRRK